MKWRICVLTAGAVIMTHAAGCGKKHEAGKVSEMQQCLETVPRNVPGLVIRGPRPKENIIENMVPIICQWRRWCENSDGENLKGTLLLTVFVNKVGEIGIVKYSSTIRDTAKIHELVNSFSLFEFDVWNEGDYETQFDFPVKLLE